MSNVPDELKEFPFDLMRQIKEGNISGHNNTDRKKWMEELGAWLYTLTELNTECYKQWKLLGIAKDRAIELMYTKYRLSGSSVSGAKIASERNETVFQCREAELEADVKARYVNQISKDTVENINILKNARKNDAIESPHVGDQPA